MTAVVNLEGGKIITVQKAKKDSEKSTKVFFILKVMLLINHLLLLMIADIYISISMGTFEHREYKSRGEDGNK